MTIAEKRAAFLILIDYLQRQLAAMPPDDAAQVPHDERPPPAPATQGQPPFLGRPMSAKFAGRCAVCRTAIGVGAPVIYNGTSKLTAHAHCGQDDGGVRR